MARTFGRLAIVGTTVALTLIGCGAQTPSAAPATAAPTARPTAATAPAATPATAATAKPTGAPTAAPTPAATPVGKTSGLAWSIRGALPAGWTTEDGNFSRSEHAYVEVLPDRSLMAASCDLRPEAGVGSSAASIASALAKRKGLTTTKPESVTVGGLSGVRIDLSLAPSWDGTCAGWEIKSPIVPLVGTFDAQHYWLFNAVAKGETDRYLLLDLPGGRNVLVAITAIDPERFSDVIGPAMEIVSKLDFAVGS
jgi:hypothetical protein